MEAASTVTTRLERAQSLLTEALAEFACHAASLTSQDLLLASDFIEKISRQIDHSQIIAASAFESIGLPEGSAQFRDVAGFLQARLRITRSEARRRLELGNKVLASKSLIGAEIPARYPLLGALSSQGAVCKLGLKIAVDALDEATSIVSRHRNSPELLSQMEESLAQGLTQHHPDFVKQLCKRWSTLVDQDGQAPSPSELRQRQGLFRRGEYRGLTHFELWADQLQPETLLTVINAGTNPRKQTSDSSHAEDRSRPQQQLDSVISALGSALTAEVLPGTGGHRPQVHVTVDYRQLLAEIHESENESAVQQRSTAQFTGPIGAHNIRTIACDAELIPVVLGDTGEILDVGRRKRFFSRSQRAALVARDQGCAFPSCSIPSSWCEAHHIRWWQHGGETSTSNGVLLCSHHHHLIHQGKWSIENRTGRPEFRPPPWIDPRRTLIRNSYHQIPAAA
ncbi:HNH endonuclease domain protein [Renibacterium salmoninarum ATCC 33209]|uniref:HNH endonuclease domain protein n=1 Tax=Renibacterium salmoninarum (strain ATCC 33209 / DSM 20767 / JCM 11484 / NBRC 15589 / NCIMB 2235) TaxID=288705 RepID=A9WRB3_RENSM|nr:HNH endonuclease signature motif containing protein [Renibacterium salmoninarum]ABY24122.1 HNH endonuclease domain protein [Renibacterium salmoninarum ATCC 33209]